MRRGEQTRQCGPGDVVTITGVFLTVRVCEDPSVVKALRHGARPSVVRPSVAGEVWRVPGDQRRAPGGHVHRGAGHREAEAGLRRSRGGRRQRGAGEALGARLLVGPGDAFCRCARSARTWTPTAAWPAALVRDALLRVCCCPFLTAVRAGSAGDIRPRGREEGPAAAAGRRVLQASSAQRHSSCGGEVLTSLTFAGC